MSVLNKLGIYTDAIETEAEKSFALLEDAMTALKRYGGSQDEIDTLYRKSDLDEVAQLYLQDNGDFSDITNSVIKAYHEAVMDAVNEIETFQNIGIQITDYVNCNDSHLCVTVNGTSSQNFYEKGDFETIVFDTVCEKYMDDIVAMIAEHLQESGKEYPREWIEEDFRTAGGEIDFGKEYMESIQSGQLTDTLIQNIEEYARPIQKQLCKETVERE